MHTSDKEQLNVNGSNHPIKLPPGIKTRLALPRVVAATLALISIVAFYTGTSALQELNLQSRSAVDNLLQLGYRHWGILTRGANAQCVGVLYSEMVTEPDPQLVANGIIYLPLQGVNKRVDLDTQIDFTSYYSLDSLHLAIKVDEVIFSASSVGENTKEISLSMQTTTGKITQSLPRPQPIYITQVVPGYFALRLPKELSNFETSSLGGNYRLDQMTGLDMRMLQPDEVVNCYEEVEAITPLFKFPDNVIDIAKYSELLKFGLNKNMLGL